MYITSWTTPLALTIFAWLHSASGLVLRNISATCDEKELQEAKALLSKGDFKNLPSSACMKPNGINEDVVEFLGNRKHRNSQQTSWTRLAPTLFFIGYEHSGSTSFADALNSHPNLSYGGMKEHRYFCKDRREIQKSREQYLREFIVPPGVTRTFDATPFYYLMGSAGLEPPMDTRCASWHQHGIGAIQAFKEEIGPDTRLIVMIRDPIDWHCSRTGPVPCLEYLRTHRPELLVDRLGSCFADHLEPWLSVFKRSDILFINSEDFFFDQRAVLSRVFKFAEVPDYSDLVQPTHSGRRRAFVRRLLEEDDRKPFYDIPSMRYCKDRLEVMTGLRFAWPGS